MDLGSVKAEDGGASTDVNVRIQKARGSFSKLRKVWLSTSIRKDTKIKIFNACCEISTIVWLRNIARHK